MGTRAQIIIKDSCEEVWFYRHSDGYPEGTLPTLEKFLDWVKSGRIRDNASQAAGWLVIIGHNEYQISDEPDAEDKIYGWKVSAYEPCSNQLHSDIDYLYTIDLEAKTITVKEV